MDPYVLGRAVVAIAVFLGALATVTWRHSRTLEAFALLDETRRQSSVAAAERVELERRIQILTSRQRVVPEARTRLGMDTPGGDEMVLLPTEALR